MNLSDIYVFVQNNDNVLERDITLLCGIARHKRNVDQLLKEACLTPTTSEVLRQSGVATKWSPEFFLRLCSSTSTHSIFKSIIKEYHKRLHVIEQEEKQRRENEEKSDAFDKISAVLPSSSDAALQDKSHGDVVQSSIKDIEPYLRTAGGGALTTLIKEMVPHIGPLIQTAIGSLAQGVVTPIIQEIMLSNNQHFDRVMSIVNTQIVQQQEFQKTILDLVGTKTANAINKIDSKLDIVEKKTADVINDMHSKLDEIGTKCGRKSAKEYGDRRKEWPTSACRLNAFVGKDEEDQLALDKTKTYFISQHAILGHLGLRSSEVQKDGKNVGTTQRGLADHLLDNRVISYYCADGHMMYFPFEERFAVCEYLNDHRKPMKQSKRARTDKPESVQTIIVDSINNSKSD